MAQNMRRFVNYQRHLCGCLTRFDTEKWRSEVSQMCGFHTAVVAHLEPREVR